MVEGPSCPCTSSCYGVSRTQAAVVARVCLLYPEQTSPRSVRLIHTIQRPGGRTRQTDGVCAWCVTSHKVFITHKQPTKQIRYLVCEGGGSEGGGEVRGGGEVTGWGGGESVIMWRERG